MAGVIRSNAEIRLNAEKVLEEIKKDAGKSKKEIEKARGLREGQIRTSLLELELSEDPEIKKLLAKRKAYMRGGTCIVRQATREPGCGYRAIDNSVREVCEKDRVKRADTEELFRGIVDYCKKWKDAELREIFLKRKKAGGWIL